MLSIAIRGCYDIMLLKRVIKYFIFFIHLFLLKLESKVFLNNEQIGKYKIMSRNACERYCSQKHKKRSIIISIKSSWDKVDADLHPDTMNNVRHILRLSFDDCEYEDNADHCMSKKDGRKVARFIKKYYDDTDVIIVHCDGGVSRSAGVCAAIMRVMEGDDYPIFDSRTKHPNMTCYLRTLMGFGYIK